MDQKEAILILEQCEKGLRGVAGQAMSVGDYEAVRRIMGWAESLKTMVREAKGDGAPNHAPLPAVAPTDLRRLGRKPHEYPRFFRRGDELVKVGWSKKERNEYNHRAPRRAFDAVVGAVRQAGAKGRLFNGDALLPVKDSNGIGVPDYQAYVALAWLKHLGVVQQRGRRAGYMLVPSKQIDSTIAAAWPELMEWQG